MAKKSIAFPLVITVASTALASGVGYLGYLAGRARLRANGAILNETLPVHSKWWRDRAEEDGELLYVALGDSAAQGIGATLPIRSYVGLLGEHIRNVTGRTVRVVNLSVSGATVAHAVADQLPKFELLKPDIVTVAIGANDIEVFDPVVFEEGLRRLFSALPSHGIVADLPYFYLPWNERKVRAANLILRRVAAEHHLTMAPLYRATRRQGIPGIVTTFAIDFFHPNDRGYRVWQSAFAPALTASLHERFPGSSAEAGIPLG